MKHLTPFRKLSSGFTLAEIAITAGIVAGTLAILAGMMSLLTRDVARLKPYEAGRRVAFDPGKNTTSASPSPTTTTPAASSNSTPNATPPKDTLPDEHLDPATARNETQPRLPADDPQATQTGTSTTPATPAS